MRNTEQNKKIASIVLNIVAAVLSILICVFILLVPYTTIHVAVACCGVIICFIIIRVAVIICPESNTLFGELPKQKKHKKENKND